MLDEDGGCGSDADEVVLDKAEGLQGLGIQCPALGPDGIQVLLAGSFGQSLLIAAVDSGDFLVPPVGSCPQRLQGGGVGLAVAAGGGHQIGIQSLRQIVAGGGQIQLQSGCLIQVDGQRTEGVQIGVHHVGAVGIPVVGGGVVALLNPTLLAVLGAGDVDEVRYAGGPVGDAVLHGVGVHRLAADAAGVHVVNRLGQKTGFFHKGLGQCGKLGDAADLSLLHAVVEGGQLKVQQSDGLAGPLGMGGVDHFPGAGGPVKLGARGAPLLGAVGDEADVVFRLVTGIRHGFGHGQHQADGAAVVLEAVEVDVIVAGHQDLLLRAAALQGAHHIVAGSLLRLHDVVHHQGSGVVSRGQSLRQLEILVLADADAGDHILGANVLHIDHVVGIGGVAAHIVGDDGAGAVESGLIHILVDPGHIPLVHAHQSDLAFHVHPLVLGGGAGAHVHQLGGNAVSVRAVGGVGGGHDLDIGVGDGERGVVELPLIHGDRHLFHRQADGLHLGGDVVGGSVLGIGTGGAPAQFVGQIGGIVGQGLGDLVGVFLVYLLQIGGYQGLGILSGRGLWLLIRLGAGSQGQQQSCCGGCGNQAFPHLFFSPPNVWSGKAAKKPWRRYTPWLEHKESYSSPVTGARTVQSDSSLLLTVHKLMCVSTHRL